MVTSLLLGCDSNSHHTTHPWLQHKIWLEDLMAFCTRLDQIVQWMRERPSAPDLVYFSRGRESKGPTEWQKPINGSFPQNYLSLFLSSITYFDCARSEVQHVGSNSLTRHQTGPLAKRVSLSHQGSPPQNYLLKNPNFQKRTKNDKKPNPNRLEKSVKN